MTPILLLAATFAADPVPGVRYHEFPQFKDQFTNLAFDPDGKSVVFATRTGAHRADFLTGKYLGVTNATGKDFVPFTHFVISPTASHFAPSSQDPVRKDGRYLLLDARTFAERICLPKPLADGDAGGAAFSADGRRVATGYYRGHDSPSADPARVVVWDIPRNKPAGAVEIPNPPGGIVSAAVVLSPDGGTLAAVLNPNLANADDRTELGTWDVATGKRTGTRLVPGVRHLYQVVILADGRGLLLVDLTGCGVWQPATATFRPIVPRRVAGTYGHIAGPAPDGRFGVYVCETSSRGEPRKEYELYLVETATRVVRRAVPAPCRGHGPNLVVYRPDGRAVAVANETGFHAVDLAPPPPAKPTPAATLWAALAGPAAAADGPMWELAARPADAVALFARELAPTKAVAVDVPTLVANLDAPAFAVREAAEAKLVAHARAALPELRAARTAAASAEQRDRLDRILANADRLTADELRQTRAVEVLERIGTPAAKMLLRPLAAGAAGAVLTREATATLARIGPK